MTDLGKVPEDYNAAIGIITFDTWWELGQFSARLCEARTETDKVALAKKHLADGDAPKTHREEFPRWKPLNPKRLVAFVETVVGLLEKKYDGHGIASEVERLCVGGRISARDDGDHLVVQEDDDRFWATEYAGLFTELTPGRSRDDWRYAVARCADEGCKAFFVKRRANQLYHSDKCRFNRANRAKASSAKRGRRVGGRI
jgi:hypothetical protein